MPWLALALAVPLSLRAKECFFAHGACAARQSRDCRCSGIACLHGKVDFKLLAEFASGIRSPENPEH
eukprot:7312062-Pyramimonas_sp.AAC.1